MDTKHASPISPGLKITRTVGKPIYDSIYIGDDIIVRVSSIKGNQVGLAIVAPQEINIARAELLERDEQPDKER